MILVQVVLPIVYGIKKLQKKPRPNERAVVTLMIIILMTYVVRVESK